MSTQCTDSVLGFFGPGFRVSGLRFRVEISVRPQEMGMEFRACELKNGS